MHVLYQTSNFLHLLGAKYPQCRTFEELMWPMSYCELEFIIHTSILDRNKEAPIKYSFPGYIHRIVLEGKISI